MTPAGLRQAMCSAFHVSEESGVLLVGTPFQVDFNDNLILRVRPDGSGFRIDDNGDTLFALAMDGAAPDADRIHEIAAGIEFDEEDGSIIACVEREQDIADAVFKVTGAALRIHSACRPRHRNAASDLKERVVELLSGLAAEMHVPISLDEVVDNNGALTADVVMGPKENPFIVVAASSVERLMEAELMYLRRQITHDPGYVCAVVPSAKAIGQKHFSRANYYTDKAVELDGWVPAFRELAQQRIMH